MECGMVALEKGRKQLPKKKTNPTTSTTTTTYGTPIYTYVAGGELLELELVAANDHPQQQSITAISLSITNYEGCTIQGTGGGGGGATTL